MFYIYIFYFPASLSNTFSFSHAPPLMIPWSRLSFSFLFIFFIFSHFYFSLYLFNFLFSPFFSLIFILIIWKIVCDPIIRSQILLCIVEIILMNFLLHKLNEFEQLIIIFKYIEYLIGFVNLDLIRIINIYIIKQNSFWIFNIFLSY